MKKTQNQTNPQARRLWVRTPPGAFKPLVFSGLRFGGSRAVAKGAVFLGLLACLPGLLAGDGSVSRELFSVGDFVGLALLFFGSAGAVGWAFYLLGKQVGRVEGAEDLGRRVEELSSRERRVRA